MFWILGQHRETETCHRRSEGVVMGVWYCPKCGERRGVTEFCSKHGAMKEDLMADPRMAELVQAAEEIYRFVDTRWESSERIRRAIAAVKESE